MANARMINKRICKSKKFAALKTDRSRVLYWMIYPNLDQEGRFTGDPEEIKEDCCPKLKYTIKKIAESIIDLADVGLLILYEYEDEPIIEYTKFEPFQPGIRKDREAPSQYPSPDQVPDNSRSTPALYLSLSLYLKKENKPSSNIVFDFTQKKFLNITEEDKTIWKEAYPGCDIKQELLKMRSWLIADPKRQKTQYKRFINNWLARVQNQGGTKGKAKSDSTWAERETRRRAELKRNKK
jgi:hypothetical protein